MKLNLRLLASLLIMVLSFSANAQKVQRFVVERIIDLPADKIWAVVGEDYGAVANSHPKIVSSNYINGSLKAGEGAERVCHFNEKGTRFLKEKMIDYDPSNMTFVNQVYQVGKFPLDADLTKAVYKVEDLGNGKTLLKFDFQYRSNPAWMGKMMKGKFKGLIEDYFISVEHHAKTGEKVNQTNFKSIKKKYD